MCEKLEASYEYAPSAVRILKKKNIIRYHVDPSLAIPQRSLWEAIPSEEFPTNFPWKVNPKMSFLRTSVGVLSVGVSN